MLVYDLVSNHQKLNQECFQYENIFICFHMNFIWITKFDIFIFFSQCFDRERHCTVQHWGTFLLLTEKHCTRNTVCNARQTLIVTDPRRFVSISMTNNDRHHYTLRYIFESLLNQTEIRLYLPYTDSFGTKRTSVWFKIIRKMVNTILFRFDL